MENLEAKLKYNFINKELLINALIHSSSKKKKNSKDNERLEFLGDRVLGLIIAERLLEKFPNEKEGDIAKRHTSLVCKGALAKIANNLNLGDFITMSEGELREGGDKNDSILADAMEAILGAIYLDSNIDSAKDVIDRFWDFDANIKPPVDAKTALQEWAQSKKLGLPIYKMVGRSGSEHSPVFEIEVSVKNFKTSKGQGKNKKEAQKNAAQNLLNLIENIK
ncbi:MAG: ribonuclease III [Alphaproteobacteria bacterium]|nr:ribonuclease III [Alphaproteobacteria bacterium]